MALETYRSKRDFTRTAEPSGVDGNGEGNSFVVQKHAARRLHYDFRLEMGGVLKSWAVTRGPSLVAGEKRLAVHVEDHPLDYGGFEGTIPKGEYGGGSVIVWDRGRWTPIGDPAKAYAKGHMEFSLDGEKLTGRWHLVRMGHREGEKRENWLLIKADDESARPEEALDILEEQPLSVLSDRPVEALEGEAPGWSSKTGKIAKTEKAGKKGRPGKSEASPAEKPDGRIDPLKISHAVKEALPDFIDPQLATLSSKPPSGKRWIHEVKLDGYRLQARLEHGHVTFLTRSGLDWTEKFGPALAAAFAGLGLETALIDGELVVEDDAGRASFSALQADLRDGRSDRFVFYAFDLLHLNGASLRAVPLLKRKAVLAGLVAPQAMIRLSEHFDNDGAEVLHHACRLGMEGVVSKVADGAYISGRGKGWLKSKCSLRQEFVVAGYVPSTASAHAIGSLLLGVQEEGRLVHVGRVGTGFSASVSADLFRKLETLRREKSPFGEKLTANEARGARFVEPQLVAEVEFRAWTADHHLRHAAFLGLREDKSASEIMRESQVTEPKPTSNKHSVKLTHPDRLYWPEEGVTKQGLADYYSEVWPHLAPFITDRPLALLRSPEGIAGQSFFQKHAWKGMNDNISLSADPAGGEEDQLLVIDDLDGLMALVQSGVLEIHPWGSTIKDIEHPDMIIMDLDPGENVAWKEVIAAAFEVKARLEKAGLVAFVKTSGGKGLHVVSPLKPKADWDSVKAFTKDIATAMASDHPDKYVATVSKAKRSGKILIDYLRNGRGNTAVAPYSTRARKGAAVSMPLEWKELSEAIGPAFFTIGNVPARLASLTEDPWKNFRKSAKAIKTG